MIKRKSTKKYFFTVEGETEKWYLSDYESDDPVHVKQFTDTMDNMKATSNLGKQISYKFGYTNLTFDLWIILHKAACNGSKAHRKNYINPLNKAYGEKIENMDEYKHEDNFKRCLGQLSLDDVRCAIERANNIMEKNRESGYCLYDYKGYKYYKENTSLAINEIIEKILKDCKLI